MHFTFYVEIYAGNYHRNMGGGRGLCAPVTLGAVMSGAIAPGRVSQSKVVPGKRLDQKQFTDPIRVVALGKGGKNKKSLKTPAKTNSYPWQRSRL